MNTACAEAGGSELTTRACGGGPSRVCGGSQQHGYGKRARAGSETDEKEPMAERGERQGRGTAVAELEPELGGAKAGAARAVERGRGRMKSRARLSPPKARRSRPSGRGSTRSHAATVETQRNEDKQD
jgi:hypothetical protein